MTIPPEWQSFLRALLSKNTRFLLIGAHALAYHVEARLTEDLDVFLEASPRNARRLRRALERFGFGLTGIDGVSFDEAWEGRVEADFHGITLAVIGRDALLENERAAGRKKDLVDVALLEAADTLD